MKVLTFKKGGIHPPENKITQADRIVELELPLEVSIPLKHHIGAESVPIVAKGDHVDRGQKIAEASGKISAPVHASISGSVKNIGMVLNAQGRSVPAITIVASEEDHALDMAKRHNECSVADYNSMSRNEILAFIANKGVVGLGGATFPTAVKLDPPQGSAAKVLLVNACECEPCLTCDDALMRAHSTEIVQGILIMMRASQVSNAIVGIEENKPEAYNAMRKASEGHPISVQLLQTKYPQGGEKQLIQALTGKEVPSGGLPISVGCIVQNVGTAYAVYRAVALKQPLIERVVTIEGLANVLAPIGMKISSLIESCRKVLDYRGVLPFEGNSDVEVVAGGPMMGQSIATLDAPVVKGLSGITVYRPLPYDPAPCIRCGECVEACPMGLEPYLLASYGRVGLLDEAKENGAMDCVECGSCSYSCPSARPIVDYIRLAKLKLRNITKK